MASADVTADATAVAGDVVLMLLLLRLLLLHCFALPQARLPPLHPFTSAAQAVPGHL